jgi:hypothetical protein
LKLAKSSSGRRQARRLEKLQARYEALERFTPIEANAGVGMAAVVEDDGRGYFREPQAQAAAQMAQVGKHRDRGLALDDTLHRGRP